jgi:hypothetical protein
MLQTELDNERDRRYAEVNVEREKALKIKETADSEALKLARDIQTYKDEKSNQLRIAMMTNAVTMVAAGAAIVTHGFS